MTAVQVGTRIVTAYGRHPEHMSVPGVGDVLGEYGTCERVNEDGWHDFRMGDGTLLALNTDRSEMVPDVCEDGCEDGTHVPECVHYVWTHGDGSTCEGDECESTDVHYLTDETDESTETESMSVTYYPAVVAPVDDRCRVGEHTDGRTDVRGWVWFPTDVGDRPICRAHALMLDPSAHRTTNEMTSEHGNVFPAWDETAGRIYRSQMGECTDECTDEHTLRYGCALWHEDHPAHETGTETDENEDEHTDVPAVAVLTPDVTERVRAVARYGDERERATRDEDVARVLNSLTPDVPTQSIGMTVYVLRKALRSMLDLGYGDEIVFLSLIMTDESTDEWALRVWSEADPARPAGAPCAVLVRTWHEDEDGCYVPCTRVIFRQYLGWDEMGGCVRVDVPETWHYSS